MSRNALWHMQKHQENAQEKSLKWEIEDETVLDPFVPSFFIPWITAVFKRFFFDHCEMQVFIRDIIRFVL